MSGNTCTTWTEADFDEMSWHDNYVHAFRLIEGSYGSGELELDIDYILEWLKSDSGKIQFRIAPAQLTFREVTNLRVSLDYGTISAAMGPFSISGIENKEENRDRYTARVWNIEVNFPEGEISFESPGFTQKLTNSAVITDQQLLTKNERTNDT